jgi:putative ABC transport system substrate-binding protein
MRRRDFIAGVGVAAAPWPLPARAQRVSKLPHVGFLSPSPQTYQDNFRRGLRDLGYVEGQTITIEYRFAGGRDDFLSIGAKELVARSVDVIVCTNSAATSAAIAATSAIPIVMVAIADPVGSGFISSLAYPGGNVTGFSLLAPETSVKQLQLLKEAVPTISRVAIFFNSLNPGNAIALSGIGRATASLGLDLRTFDIRDPQDRRSAFDAATKVEPDGLLALPDQITIRYRADLVEFARKISRPASYALREFVLDGGLMSYGASFGDLYYRAAGYVDRIIKGAKPTQLPVQQPTKFEFVINLKTAKALGLDVPPTVLARADEVIE